MPVYPAPSIVVVTPLALLPFGIASWIFVAASIASLIAALRLVGVSDWRCYGVAFLSWLVLHGLMLGALTMMLVLGIAVMWHTRRSTFSTAAALSAVVVAKLFPWPMIAWLVATRRLAAAVTSVLLGLAACLLAWWTIDFHGLRAYPSMLADLSYVSRDLSVSLAAGLHALGAPGAVVTTGVIVALAFTLAAAWRLARRGCERTAFGMVVIAALVASPIVWPHYLALLFVPIALLAPQLSPLWFVPLLTDLAPIAQSREQS